MRGIVTGAMLMGLQDMGLLNVFDAVYGEAMLCGLPEAGVKPAGSTLIHLFAAADVAARHCW